MLTPPDGVPETALAPMLERWWGLAAASVQYQAVGWGSHHWDVTDTAGRRWFVTLDELEHKRRSADEPLTAGFGRLRAALAAARDLRDGGASFVVAPVPTADGEPVARVSDGYGVAVYPFIDGQRFHWGEFASPEHRLGVLGLVAAVHTAPAAARRHARADDYAVPHRDDLEAACAPAGEAPDCGPYARSAALLMKQHAAPVGRLLARYDSFVRQARARGTAAVLTHGEPHPGNTMRTADGWLLIDWDTALVAPPERDLWSLDPGDGSILEAYARATGVRAQPYLLDLYRLQWDIADVAIEVSRFRRPHSGSIDDDEAWTLLRSNVENISA